MKYEVAFTDEAHTTAREHLLRHFQQDIQQEDLSFALWRPSTGHCRLTALIYEIVLPEPNEHFLHGNVSFSPDYMSRAISKARQQGVGLALLHSHPHPGWQPLSPEDAMAERDILAYPTGVTGLPLVGLTIGEDGCWSARFWSGHGRGMGLFWCDKVRILGPKSYVLHFNDDALTPPPRREILKRTYDSWGEVNQNVISRMHVGIIGLGSVGCIVAETMARIGVGRVTLVDPDRVKCHNLDRLLYGNTQNIGEHKVSLAKRKMQQNATAESIRIQSVPVSIDESMAYKRALDCDVIFSCVDRPVPRDVLNYIAHAHLIPVFDCGIRVVPDPVEDTLFAAHWRAYTVTPYHQCLRCNGQYDSSQVVMEREGSLDEPSYVEGLPSDAQLQNQNVFPFSLSIASMTVNQMLRYLIGPRWWPAAPQEHYQFVTGQTSITNKQCLPHCSFPPRLSQGDAVIPYYICLDRDVTPNC